MALGWDYYIDQANRWGKDDLRKRYIQLRDAGFNYDQLAAHGGFEFDGGYNYNPLQGRMSFGPDSNWWYDQNQNITNIGGQQYQGYFDPQYFDMITEDDWAASKEALAPRLASMEGVHENAMEMMYMRALKERGGLYNDSVDVDFDRMWHAQGFGKDYEDIYKQYSQELLQHAYGGLQQRMGGELPPTIKDTLQNQDWVAAYKNLISPPVNEQAWGQEAGVSNLEGYRQHMYRLTGDERYKGTLGESQPGTPSTPTQPSLPSTPQESATGSQFGDYDWGSLFDQMSNYFMPQQQAGQPREQIGSFQQYGPTIAQRQQSYVSSTPYSGKGA